MRQLPKLAWFAMWAAFLSIDQGSKWFAINHLRPSRTPMPCIPGLVELQYAENIGAAFSVLPGKTWVLIGIAVFTIGLIGLYLALSKGEDGPVLRLGLTLILAGTVGNLLDRCRYQFVIDFFHFVFPGWERFPIFNFADIFIDVGVALLFVDFVMDLFSSNPETKTAD